MNLRTKYLIGLLGICFATLLTAMISESLMPDHPSLRFVPLFALLAGMAAAVLLTRRFWGQLPPPSPELRKRAIRSSRRLAWMYIGVLVLWLVANWRAFLALPYGVGFLLLLVPIGLATIISEWPID